jgi:hypothetical protein
MKLRTYESGDGSLEARIQLKCQDQYCLHRVAGLCYNILNVEMNPLHQCTGWTKQEESKPIKVSKPQHRIKPTKLIYKRDKK